MKYFNDGRDWFMEKRFGLFVHWGLYAIEGWHEQHQMRLNVPRKEYEKLAAVFNPSHFDPDVWIDLAQAAGMEYLTFTTKHQDGFCMWDTAQTDYKVTNSPYGKDVLAQIAEACHRRDFPLCLYYCIVDNHHINYPANGEGHGLRHHEPDNEPDTAKYLDYVRKQVEELCTNYGKIHGFWWDVNEIKVNDPSFNIMIRELQPEIVINDRGFDEGDFGTPEREYEEKEIGHQLRFSKPTEACNSVGVQSWGYRREEDYYSLRYLIQSIDSILAKGGNYLLNVGPDAEGLIPVASAALLRSIGDWYSRVSEAFDHTEPASEFTDNNDVFLTRKGTTLYVHLADFPRSNAVVLNPICEAPVSAVLLNSGQDIETTVDMLPVFYESAQKYLVLKQLPVNEYANEVLVIRLEFAKSLEHISAESAKKFVG